MKRIGAFFLAVIIIAVSIAGMWVYQSWRDAKEAAEEQEMLNAYIVKKEGDSIKVYTQEGETSYPVRQDMKEQVYEGIGDLYIRRGEVERLVCKPERISGRVLKVQVETMDIENYGSLPIDKKCSWFTVKDGVSASTQDNLYIGQTDVEFAVAGGRICGVLFKGDVGEEEQEKEQNIRVILKTDGFSGYEHASVKVRGTKKVIVKEGKEQTEYQPGEEIGFSLDNMKENRVTISSEEGGKIQITSMTRNGANPFYRGKIELVKAEQGLHIINDLPLEEYLYGVVPSEMPAEYGAEALKAQAVCARSYAVRHIRNNRLKQMGAHVDDSTSYQVYNNTSEDERCNRAVDETKGKKVYHDGKVASTYFFSTSCGVTTSAEDVTFSSKPISYLVGKLQEKEFEDEEKKERARLVSDTFGNEDLFRKFLQEDRDILEKEEPWYRWSTTISAGDMEHNINSRLGARCQASGEKIQVRQPDGTYAAQEIESIGELKRVKIKKRKSGGVVYMAVIVGTEATVRVYSEYNIRMLLFNENAIVRKNDGKSVSGMNMLPSGFFVMDKSGSSYEIRGGGFGHGTGMSQTGANELAQAGKSCEEILKYYFDGVELRE
ncbi:MAG: SpoIID/LytB domain-containing protein [Roseburia sp.]|nr:SpoIID/LytB domain-containing protein [Roseburia sp.]